MKRGVDRAAAHTAGHEGEWPADGGGAVRHGAVSLRRARGKNITAGKQRGDHIAGDASADVLQGEVEGDGFARVNGAVGRRAGFRDEDRPGGDKVRRGHERGVVNNEGEVLAEGVVAVRHADGINARAGDDHGKLSRNSGRQENALDIVLHIGRAAGDGISAAENIAFIDIGADGDASQACVT